MIAYQQIVAAALITAIAILIAARFSRWPLPQSMSAAIVACGYVIAWRAVANVAHLNADFMPAVSVGDVGCLFFGGLAPAIFARGTVSHRPWLPAIVGGVVAFFANVILL